MVVDPDGPGRSWMLAFQGGDEAAFDRIVLHYGDGVRRFIHRYVQDPHRAEDLAQEAFLRVYRARKRYRPAARFRTWLFTIATRLCLNDLRSRRRERRVIVPLHSFTARSPSRSGGAEGGEEDYLQTVADPVEETVEDSLARKEMEEAVEEAIARLPPAQRSAILLLRLEELSYQEIAEAMGISMMAVKSLIHRGRENLRESLGRFLREEGCKKDER